MRSSNKTIPAHVWYYQRTGSTLSADSGFEAATKLTSASKSLHFQTRKHLEIAINFDVNLLERLTVSQLYLATLASSSHLDTNPDVAAALTGDQLAINKLAAKHNMVPSTAVCDYYALQRVFYLNPPVSLDLVPPRTGGGAWLPSGRRRVLAPELLSVFYRF